MGRGSKAAKKMFPPGEIDRLLGGTRKLAALLTEKAAELDRLLDERFAQSLARTGAYLHHGALGFVTPHAGPAWSGTVAAAVYRSLLQQPPERVVLLASLIRTGSAPGPIFQWRNRDGRDRVHDDV